jgi:protein-S-isoprenylcysteine O-methyltransferase Ste14
VSSPRGARVRIPPVLIFAGGLLVSWALHQGLPFEIDGAGASPIQKAVGATLLSAGVLLMAWGIRTLLMARTTILPTGIVRRVVVSGPFRFTRNPIYVAMTAIYLGLAILLNAAWPIVCLPVVLVVLRVAVISREESYLYATFGEAYESYCRHVRRWL